jgi:hypothetical protein
MASGGSVVRISRMLGIGVPIACSLALVGATVLARADTSGLPSSGAAFPASSTASDEPGMSATSAAAAVTTKPKDSTAAGKRTLHYVSNVGSDRSEVAKLGFNLFDMGPDKAAIDALPRSQRALVWLGNLDNTNCTPGYSWSEFTAAVDRLAGDPKVFGYFLSDEPHPSVCPNAVAHVRQRADYIRAKDPSQRSFIVVLDSSRECGANVGCEYSALRPELSHIDLIGLDPFPCVLGGGCDLGKIDDRFHRAIVNGIPKSAIVPVFQTFGQTCNPPDNRHFAVPTEQQMRSILARFAALMPDPVFDFSFGWGSKGTACPALDRADGTNGVPDLQSVMREHNLAG